jgi:ligand-binding sensor domain-containing protein
VSFGFMIEKEERNIVFDRIGNKLSLSKSITHEETYEFYKSIRLLYLLEAFILNQLGRGYYYCADDVWIINSLGGKINEGELRDTGKRLTDFSENVFRRFINIMDPFGIDKINKAFSLSKSIIDGETQNIIFKSCQQGEQKGDWIIFNTSNSDLPSDNVKSIVIDKNGQRWIGTDNGLVRFDKMHSWISYSVNCNSIAIDYNDNKWIGTDGGLIKFDGRKLDVYNVPKLNPYEGSYLYIIHSVAIDHSNNIWLTTSGKLIKFDGKKNWVHYPISPLLGFSLDIMSVAVDHNNDTKWIAAMGRFIKFTNQNQWAIVRQPPIVGGGILPTVVIDNNNNKWIGAGAGEVARCYETKSGNIEWKVYDPDDWGLRKSFQFSCMYAAAIAIDSNGNKWIGHADGLSKLDDKSKKWIIVPNPFNIGGIQTIAIDSKGNKWIGTSRSGLVVYREKGVIF